MADSQFSSPSLPAHESGHPMARPGYGKRPVSGQPAPTAHDFVHLPRREEGIAWYIERLGDGADISAKTLAAELPYGQCAMRTALNRLQAAGHLRRGREHLAGGRWITRTWWSRVPRDDGWWAAFRRGDVPEDGSRHVAGDVTEDASRDVTGDMAGGEAGDALAQHRARPTRSRAVILLVALAREAPALTLSAIECARLGPLVDEWFERGATERDVLRALTDGLPSPIHHPAGLVRSRLISKLPPEPAPARPPLRLLECGRCGAPALAEALRDGDCGPCRGASAPPSRGYAAALSPAEVRAHMSQVRAAAGRPRAHADRSP
ncbi:hypothetical protein ABZ532_16105 [Streptomyces sp. NPDC019396]|uniref:hypothetical protein n=1 Tax=Streptomyces sp. NPDC019396 TaxID=3154687 RepID=UPI00340527FC